MDYIKISDITLYGVNGEGVTGDGKASLTVKDTPHGGRAYYVSASLDGGFSADKALTASLGIPDTSEYLAIENHSQYWCRPFWGGSLGKLPERVQELLIKDGDVYRVLLPVCADTFKTVICGGGGGAFIRMSANTSRISECKEQLAFVYMEGRDPFEVLENIARDAAVMLGNGMKMRNERKYPEALEYLGWCSWDAFQIRVNHEGLLEKAKEFKDKGVPIGFAIIDDMWGDAPNLENYQTEMDFGDMVRAMHASPLRNFEGAPKRFPKGMKAAVSDLHESGIKNIGIWFPTTGYWWGVEKGSPLEEELKDVLVTSETGRIVASPEKERTEKYFDILCGKTKDFGADFVKIDNQGFHINYRNMASFGQSAGAVQSAIESATEKYFGGALINCMGMPSECLFNRKESAVCRCSDDFIPEDRAWFLKNVLQCSYNGLMQGQYHVNDWDMWWTDDGQAVKNSLCRAISGGPVYVSDKLGRTNPEILKPMALSNGRILRGDESAKPSADCLIGDPTVGNKIFKIYNRVGDCGVVAVYNINAKDESVSGSVGACDMRLPEGRYAYYEFFGRKGGILERGETLDVTLPSGDDFKLYTFVPLTDGVAVMGRTDLFMGVKAAKRDGKRVSLAEGGDVAVISERPIRVTSADGKEVRTERNGALTKISLSKEQTELTIF